jgi:hypothetical protein
MPPAASRTRPILERLHGLRDAKENLERTSTDGISPERAVAWLEALSATWRAAEVPAERADLLHAIYDRITIAGRKIVSVRLTPSAYAHGFALALPEKVAVARPTVSEFTTCASGDASQMSRDMRDSRAHVEASGGRPQGRL